jgi:PAS domain S-box-containing protein
VPAATESPRPDALSQNLFDGVDVSYQQIFAHNPLPMWLYDVQSLRLLAVNAAALAMYGYSEDAFLALSVPDLYVTEDVPRLLENLTLPLLPRVAQRTWRHRHCNGTVLDVEIVTQDLALGTGPARMVMVVDLSVLHEAEQAQLDLNQRLTSTLENMSDAFFMVDRNGHFTYINAQAEKVLQCRREELLGRVVWDAYPDAVGTVYQTEFKRALADSCTTNFEARDAGGLNRWLSVTSYPSKDGLAVYFRDITEKHETEQELQKERQTLAAVTNVTSDALISVDLDGRVTMFNPGAERIFRRTRESMLGQSLDLLLPPTIRATHPQNLRAFAASDTSSRALGLTRRVKGVRSDGQVLVLEAIISRVELDGQQLLIACLRDVTDRVRLDAEAQRSKALLIDLTQRLMTQERALVKGLAQTLHDQLGQTMAAIRMAHETILTLQSDQGVAVSPGVARLQGQVGVLVGQAIAQIRQVLVDLRPPLLEEQGFVAALDNELRNRALAQPQIDISFHVVPQMAQMRWPAEVEYAAFMVAREAVENALRHSGSPSVEVRLSGQADALEVEVEDDGEGIAQDASKKERHLGILGMYERAQMIGATVLVDSAAGRGTRVIFRWAAVS